MALQHPDCVSRAVRVYFVFHPRRSSADLARLPAWLCDERSTEPAAQVAQGLRVWQLSGAAFRARMRSEDPRRVLDWMEPLLTQAELVKVVLELPDGTCAWIPKPGSVTPLEAFDYMHIDQAAAEHFPDPARYLDEVRVALTQVPTAWRRHAQFFALLDRGTSGDLIDLGLGSGPSPYSVATIEDLKRCIQQVWNVLLKNLPRRTLEPGSRAPRLVGMKVELERLAKHFLDLVLASYPATLDGEPGLEESIELFATGALRMQLVPSLMWTCQPNSAYYFLFAEFALCVYELVQRGLLSDPRWTRELALRFANVTVRTQPLFVQAYGRRARDLPAPGPGDYRAFDYDPREAARAVELIPRQRRDYRSLSFAELCERSAEHLARFVPGWPRTGKPVLSR